MNNEFLNVKYELKPVLCERMPSKQQQ